MDPTPTPNAMEALITAVSSVFTALLGWFSDVGESVISQPVLIVFLVAIPVISFVFGLVMKIVGRRGRRK